MSSVKTPGLTSSADLRGGGRGPPISAKRRGLSSIIAPPLLSAASEPHSLESPLRSPDYLRRPWWTTHDAPKLHAAGHAARTRAVRPPRGRHIDQLEGEDARFAGAASWQWPRRGFVNRFNPATS